VTVLVVGTEVEETVLLGTVVVGAALVGAAVVDGGPVVVVAKELGTLGAAVVGPALLVPLPPPQPAISPADSNTAGQ
jgi:hypothetical protein